ncbi:MAG TPA: hypothetical protein VGE90_11470 [Chitinophaga sp.]
MALIQRSVSTPELYCPFPTSLNPQVTLADEHTAEWVKKFGLVRSDEVFQHYREQKFTWMVARMFPSADFEALCIAADLNTLLFVLDDQYDETGADSEDVRKKENFEMFLEQVRSILQDHERKTLPLHGPALAAISDFWERICRRSSPAWQLRFAESMKRAFVANLWRIELVKQNRLPAVAEYMQFRQQFGGANFFADLVEVMEHISLPDEVIWHSTIQTMITLCSDTICYANDLFSYKKELLQGDEMNLVMLLKRHEGLSLEDAVFKATEIHDDKVKQFVQLAGQLPSFSKETDTELRRFVNALAVMMRGNIDWSRMDTARYQMA